MEDLRGRITRAAKEMRGSNQRIAIYMRDNYDDLKMLPINELAKRAGVSQSTVFRFSQTLGYSGYPEMKMHLSMQLQQEEKPTKKLEIEPGESSAEINHKLAGRYKIVVDETSRMLDDQLVAKTVEAFAKTKQIVIYGAGASSVAADALALKLTRIGRQAVAVRDLHMAMMRVVTADPQTVFVVISNWGANSLSLRVIARTEEAGYDTNCVDVTGQVKCSTFVELDFADARRWRSPRTCGCYHFTG